MAPPDLNDIELELLGEQGAQHAALMEEIHRSFMWLHGFGGLMIVVLSVAAPVSLRIGVPEVASFQLALVAFGALLVGLTALKHLSNTRGAALRARVEIYCAQHQTTPAELVALSHRLGARWFFFRALVGGRDGEEFAADARR